MRCFCSVMAVLVVASDSSSNDEIRFVEQFGDTDTIRFTGTTTFAESELRRALEQNVRVQAVAHSKGLLDQLTRRIEEELTAGYRRSGFGDAEVRATVRADSDHITVRVEEGIRYRCGAIIVSGAQQIDVAFTEVHRVDEQHRRATVEHAVALQKFHWGAPMPISDPFKLFDTLSHMRVDGQRVLLRHLGHRLP